MRIGVAAVERVDWTALDQLLRSTYAFMDGRIDPPSSLVAMTVDDLKHKAIEETLVTATQKGALVGCLFCRTETPWLYVGKFAVAIDYQGKGVGAALMGHARTIAEARELDGMELETRIELTENHAAFRRMGFAKVADQSHEGFDRPTSIRMRATFS